MATKLMNNFTDYQNFIKPEWAPPAWLFGPVWTVLYALIAISFGWVFYQYFKKKLRASVTIPFFLNLLFNFVFTPIQFGLKINWLATIDILLVLATLIWAISAIYPKKRWVAFINIPYLLWVMFATVLQISVTILNW